MKVLLYEWCSSGGLAGPDAAGLIPETDAAGELAGMVREGRSMLEALVADAARCHTLQITVLVDAARPLETPAGVAVRTEVRPPSCVKLALPRVGAADDRQDAACRA